MFKEFVDMLKEYEIKGDNYVYVMIKEFNKVFIIFIECEDIFQLINSLDDVFDGIEYFFVMMEIFLIILLDEYIDKFSGYIRECVKEILIMIELLVENCLKDIQFYVIKIKEYEYSCDNLYRKLLKNFFGNEIDLIKVI